MSGFGDNFDRNNDVDPAAEFLAREQNELAGLEDELKPAASAINSSSASASAIISNGDDPNNSPSSFEMVENFQNEPDIINNGLEKKDLYENEFIDNHNNDLFQTERNEEYFGSSGVSPPLSLSQARDEPEKIKKWREEQVKRLEEKDQEEEKKKEELRGIAKKELDDWYRNHEEAIAKTKAANRNAEKQFVAEDDEIQPGTEWERIAKLCDFNPKAKPGSKDVSRMRSIILQMKQNPVSIKNKA